MTRMQDADVNIELKKEELLRVLEQTNVSAFFDGWGPANVIHVYDSEINMQGILVIDNTTMGPGCGCIGISPTVTPRQVFQNARKITLSCALVNINFGGAAAGIRADPLEVDKIQLIKTFARGVSPYVPDQYIAAPATSTGQVEMAAFAEEVGDRRGATGKPESMNGIPFELGVIGFGMGVAIEAAIDAQTSPSFPSHISDAKIAIQGFDSIGSALAKYLGNKGAKVVAIGDEHCAICDYKGININEILKHISGGGEKKSLRNCKDIRKLKREGIINVKCDIFVPTTGNKILTDENVKSLKARCVVEGINDPINSIADMFLQKRKVLVLPDILTICGGSLSSYAEHNRFSAERAFSLIESRIKDVTKQVIHRSIESVIPVRRIVKEIAKERILEATEAG